MRNFVIAATAAAFAAVGPAAAQDTPGAVDVVIHPDSICVSVVFEPDTLVGPPTPAMSAPIKKSF